MDVSGAVTYMSSYSWQVPKLLGLESFVAAVVVNKING